MLPATIQKMGLAVGCMACVVWGSCSIALYPLAAAVETIKTPLGPGRKNTEHLGVACPSCLQKINEKTQDNHLNCITKVWTLLFRPVRACCKNSVWQRSCTSGLCCFFGTVLIPIDSWPHLENQGSCWHISSSATADFDCWWDYSSLLIVCYSVITIYAIK